MLMSEEPGDARNLLLGQVVLELARVFARGFLCRVGKLDVDLLAEAGISPEALERDLIPGGLHAATADGAVGADPLQVDGGADDFDVVERELGTLRDHLTVQGDEGAAVVVQPVAVATLLVRVEVQPARLERRFLFLVVARALLAQLVVLTVRVFNYIAAVLGLVVVGGGGGGGPGDRQQVRSDLLSKQKYRRTRPG